MVAASVSISAGFFHLCFVVEAATSAKSPSNPPKDAECVKTVAKYTLVMPQIKMDLNLKLYFLPIFHLFPGFSLFKE